MDEKLASMPGIPRDDDTRRDILIDVLASIHSRVRTIQVEEGEGARADDIQRLCVVGRACGRGHACTTGGMVVGVRRSRRRGGERKGRSALSERKGATIRKRAIAKMSDDESADKQTCSFDEAFPLTRRGFSHVSLPCMVR